MESIPKFAKGGIITDGIWSEHDIEDVPCEIVCPLNDELIRHIKEALYDNRVKELTIKVGV